LIGFIDADFAGDVDARKSTTKVILANNPITWQLTKEKVVFNSVITLLSRG
jgi:hypothetical protein